MKVKRYDERVPDEKPKGLAVKARHEGAELHPQDDARSARLSPGFSIDRNLNFPLLSDFDPKGAISRTYGVFTERNGESARALFVIDPKGIIRWSYLSPDGVNPGADGILSALEKLQSPG